MSRNTMSVSSLVSFLKMKIDQDLYIQNIIVKGEISNFTLHRSNHIYFTLKDEKSRIQCVMFASNAGKLKFRPKDGDKVLVHCSTSIFEASGQLQLYVKTIQLDGLGDKYLALIELKKKLYEKGLFDDDHKNKLNKYPLSIGIITGHNSAAYADIIKTLNIRWPMAKLFIFPVLVQGEQSSIELVNSINKADTMDLDLIILARGGGSIEDLWAFNDELLANTIYSAKTPISTGIGHESDETIAEMVADIRCATPTASVVSATPDINEVISDLKQKKQLLIRYTNDILMRQKEYLNNIKSSVVFDNKDYLLMDPSLRLEYLCHRLLNSQSWLNKYQEKINSQSNKLKNLMANMYQLHHNNLYRKIDLLDAYSPVKILKRGYSLVYKDEVLINSSKLLKVGDKLSVKLDDGHLITEIKEINND